MPPKSEEMASGEALINYKMAKPAAQGTDDVAISGSART